ncbi:MAG: hypothetical protein WC822_06810 [Candidatus Paceibacterota bacterium]|jgi:hypothetical protein
MMIYGFTGTRRGMSDEQKYGLLRTLLADGGGSVFHHGDCVGADAEAHRIARDARCIIFVHPPSVRKYRAFCIVASSPYIWKPKPYLQRNRDIVDICDVLIAAPYDDNRANSGTWYTINYAKSKGKKIIILERSTDGNE